ncbi:MAG: cation transporter, partial [Deltaproteobacteria bacterium]
MQKITIQISGMHCASCSSRLENNIKKTTGIISASVNIVNQKAVIEFDSEKVDVETIFEIVGKTGFAVITDGNEASATETEMMKRQFVFSVALGIPLFYLAMAEMLALPIGYISYKISIIIQFIITTAIMALNSNLYIDGLRKLIRRNPNMDSLVEIGT